MEGQEANGIRFVGGLRALFEAGGDIPSARQYHAEFLRGEQSQADAKNNLGVQVFFQDPVIGARAVVGSSMAGIQNDGGE